MKNSQSLHSVISPSLKTLTIGAARVNAHINTNGEGSTISAQTAISDLSFEQALSSLEEIVQKLESGSVPLDQSIELYEKGEALRKHCQQRLDSAQQRIEQIVADKDGNAQAAQPFDGAE